MTMQSLQKRISGTVLHRGDPNYEQARRASGWNEIKPERYPDLIVQVTSEDDVIEAVNFAREEHMKIGIRGGDTTGVPLHCKTAVSCWICPV
jgi:FAD/FMN-containing dehydrogenase